jgi:hypothetical protein
VTIQKYAESFGKLAPGECLTCAVGFLHIIGHAKVDHGETPSGQIAANGRLYSRPA